MSALGHKQTKRHQGAMSALPPKADIEQTSRYVRFVPKANNAVHKKRCYSMTSSAVLDSLAWHPRFDPGLQHFDEVLVRERGSRALARGPGPEDERIRLHVLDDLLSRADIAAALPNVRFTPESGHHSKAFVMSVKCH